VVDAVVGIHVTSRCNYPRAVGDDQAEWPGKPFAHSSPLEKNSSYVTACGIAGESSSGESGCKRQLKKAFAHLKSREEALKNCSRQLTQMQEDRTSATAAAEECRRQRDRLEESAAVAESKLGLAKHVSTEPSRQGRAVSAETPDQLPGDEKKSHNQKSKATEDALKKNAKKEARRRDRGG